MYVLEDVEVNKAVSGLSHGNPESLKLHVNFNEKNFGIFEAPHHINHTWIESEKKPKNKLPGGGAEFF